MTLKHHRGETDRGYVESEDPGEPAGPGKGRRRVSVTDQEGKILSALARNKVVLEIGTGIGVATNWLEMHALNLETLDIDPWVQEHVWPTLPKRVLRRTERSTLKLYDMVFIDGEHTDEALKADIKYALDRLVTGGLVVVHDAIELRETIKAQKGDWFTLDTRYGLAIHALP